MPTVPRPEHAPQPNDTEALRDLLAAIADVLDIPLGDDPTAARQLTRDRAILVKSIARDASGLVPPSDPAQHLRTLVAEYAPNTPAVPGE